MLILNAHDIENSVTISDLLISIEKAFLMQEEGSYYMPDRSHHHYRGNVLLTMPCFNDRSIGIKLITVFPENKRSGKPSISGAMLLNDGKTGETLAIMEGAKLTALRTGAIGAMGIAFTSPVNTSSIGLIGAGVQGFHQILFSAAIRNFTHYNVFDPYHPDLKRFVSKIKKYLPDAHIAIVNSVEELLDNSEVIITATTTEKPVIRKGMEDLCHGKHFIGIGSFKPEMQEYDESLFHSIKQVYIDTDFARQESGDLRIPIKKDILDSDKIYRLGQLMNKSSSVDITMGTLFKSVGMALFDLVTAEKIYSSALEKGIGQHVEF